jgi:hypothetical protein
VFDFRGLPDYPPARNAWEFPPPPVSPRWRWVAIAATVFGLVAGTSLLVVAIAYGSSGAPGLIDDTRIVDVIERECQQMTTKVESLPIHGTPRRQAQSIAAQNVAIDDMVTDIRAMGPEALASDPPTEEWLADWERLVDAREAYAEEILDGSLPDLDIPTDDRGEDIYVRMDDAFIGESSCEVPSVILNPYPEDSSEA